MVLLAVKFAGWLLITILLAQAAPSRRFATTTVGYRNEYFDQGKSRHRLPKPTPGTHPVDVDGENDDHLDNFRSGTDTDLLTAADCAKKVKGDLTSLTCANFLREFNLCESLDQWKELVMAAKRNYKKTPDSKKPCFQ